MIVLIVVSYVIMLAGFTVPLILWIEEPEQEARVSGAPRLEPGLEATLETALETAHFGIVETQEEQ